MVAIPFDLQITIRYATYQDLPALEWEGEFAHFRHVFAEAYRLKELGEVIIWIAELIDFGILGQLFIQLYGPHQLQSNSNRYAYISPRQQFCPTPLRTIWFPGCRPRTRYMVIPG
jgi:hypothetical protein